MEGRPISSPNDVVRLYDKLWSDRMLFDVLAQDLAQFIIPHKSYILFRLAPGAKQTVNLYDTTAIHANNFLAASMAGTLTPASSRWFSLRMEDDDLNQDYETQVWLDAVSTRMFGALNHSNFRSESHEFYLDIGCFGTATLLAEEIQGPQLFNGMRFRCQPYAYYVIDENGDGKVDTVARKLEMTIRAMADKFGVEALTQDQKRLLQETGPTNTQLYEIIHLIQPNPNYREGSKKERPWASYYVERKSLNTYLKRDGFFEMPWLVARWSKSAGEMYGRGPGHTTLPDIKTINKARELRMRYAAKVTDPPLAALDDSVIGRIRTSPAAITPVRTKDALTPLFDPRGGHYQIAEKFEEELKQQIRAGFYSDLLQIPTKNYMTATEVQAAQQQIQQALGPTIGRLESEFLTPLIDRVFGIMFRAGVLPDVPQALVQAQQRGTTTKITVVYEGPLARTQRFSDLAAMERAIQLLAPVIKLSPTAGQNLDSDEIARYIWQATGNPSKLLRSEDSVKEIRDQQHAELQQQQQQQMGVQTAETMAKVLPAMKDMAQPADQSGTEEPQYGQS